MKIRYSIFSLIILCCLLFAGCSSSDDGSVSTDSGSTTETSFNFTLTSLKRQETAAGKMASFTADQVMTGQLQATNIDTSVVQTFDWSIYFDENTYAVQSNKTIILTPGTYEFALLVVKGDQQYAGSVAGISISDGTFDVPLTIRPVIGNTVTDVTLVASLAEFKFQYDPAELAAASLVNPQMGIIINGGAEAIYGINPASGISDTWINLDEGASTLQLKLYDGSLQVGRSITAQESVIVTAGLNITIDLVALHGETTFALTEAGGDASFTFNIPADVVNEAGGLGNLQVLFSLVGPNNPLDENPLTLAPDGTGDYEAGIVLSNKQFDEVTLSLAFTDTSVSELLGSCAVQATLDTTQRTLNCDVTLRRRAVIGGSLLATLGINVFSDAGEPVAGAVVTENGNILGITGSGSFGTAGYLKVYKHAGIYQVMAEANGAYGEESVSLDTLGINNYDLTLGPMEAIAPTVSYSNLVNNSTVESGYILGTASDNFSVSEVEVRLDGGAWSSATGTTSWKFTLPTGSSTWALRSQHTIAARSRDNAGNYSNIATIFVRKGNNNDVNGDGYPDLAVSAFSKNANKGRSYVFYGGPSGLMISSAGSADVIIDGESSGNRFGCNLQLGDINHDGYADLVSGAGLWNSSGGRAYLFYGSPSGISTTDAGSADSIISSETTSTYLGYYIAFGGDINGDGFGDLALTAYSYATAKGRAYLFHGSSSGISSNNAANADTILTGKAGSTYLGWNQVDFGDSNGDGYADLAISAAFYSTEVGQTYIFHGGPAGIPHTNLSAGGVADTTITGQNANDYLGGASFGDLDNDGFDDLITGAYQYPSGSALGRVYIFRGDPSGISDSGAGAADTILTGESPSYFGGNHTTGDMDADGNLDLIIGGQSYSSSAGRSYLFYGSPTGIDSKNASSADIIITGESTSSGLGIQNTFTDVNGDGYLDYIIGAYQFNSSQGRVYIFHGSSAGIASTDIANANTIISGESVGDTFGRFISR